MREDKTAETKDARQFEERVLAKFDLVDERLDDVTIRLGKLEQRQYDTKPIWERALAEIAEMNARMNAGFNSLRSELKVINLRMDAMDQRFDAMEQRFDAMNQRFDAMDQHFDAMDQTMIQRFDAIDARFAKQDTDSDHNFRGFERKLDVLNHNILQTKADQRYIEHRLEKIEAQVFPDDCI
jgi:hypothetical protein